MSSFQPDFNELLKVVAREKPSRPVLFEFYMNDNVYNRVVDDKELPKIDCEYKDWLKMAWTFYRWG